MNGDDKAVPLLSDDHHAPPRTRADSADSDLSERRMSGPTASELQYETMRSAGAPKFLSSHFPDIKDPEKLYQMKLALAAAYVRDAVHSRKPNIRIQMRGDWWYTPLEVYTFIHSVRWRWFVSVCILIHMGLAFFERPALISTSEHFAWTAPLEVIFFALYLLDSFLLNYSKDTATWKRSLWFRCKILCVAACALELLIHSLQRAHGTQGARYMRMLRPVFLLDKGRSMRKLGKDIVHTVREVMPIVFLLAVHILFYGFAGFLLFSRKAMGIGNNENFETIEKSFLNLFILLTTANHPDVMMPSYTENNWSALYFIAYLAFGLYFLLNLVLAVIFNAFHISTKAMCERNLQYQCKALAAGFDVLAPVDQEDQAIEEREIPFSVFSDFMVAYRKDLQDQEERARKYAMLVFHVLLDKHLHVGCSNRMHVGCTLGDGDEDEDVSRKRERGVLGITIEHWRLLLEYIDIDIEGDVRPPSQAELIAGISTPWRRREFIFRHDLRALLSQVWVERLFDTIVLANAIFIVVSFDLGKDRVANYKHINRFFISCFTFEVLIKLYAFRISKYLSSGWNCLDVVVTGISLSAEMVRSAWVSNVSLFRVLRLLRVLRTLDRFRAIISTFRKVLPALIPFFGILFCVYYGFAIAGMELFAGKITKDNEAALIDVLKDSGYIEANYWENNFNDITHSLVTLWDLMVVNNWFIIMNAYADATHRLARLYFVFFYFITVIVALNIIIAFILEAFMAQYANETRREEAGDDEQGGLISERFKTNIKATAKRITRKRALSVAQPHFTEFQSQTLSDEAVLEHLPEARAAPTARAPRFSVVGNIHSHFDFYKIDDWVVSRKQRSRHIYMEMFEMQLDTEKIMSLRESWITDLNDITAERERIQDQRLAAKRKAVKEHKKLLKRSELLKGANTALFSPKEYARMVTPDGDPWEESDLIDDDYDENSHAGSGDVELHDV